MSFGIADDDPGIARAARECVAVVDPPRWICEARDGHPERVLDLGARRDRRGRSHVIDERRDHETDRLARVSALEVVETPQQLGLREVDAHLFEGLTLGGVLQALVRALDAAARERHLARPRISGATRPLDQEHLERRSRRPKQHRDGRVANAGLVDQMRLVGGHRGADAGEIEHGDQDSPADWSGRR